MHPLTEAITERPGKQMNKVREAHNMLMTLGVLNKLCMSDPETAKELYKHFQGREVTEAIYKSTAYGLLGLAAGKVTELKSSQPGSAIEAINNDMYFKLAAASFLIYMAGNVCISGVEAIVKKNIEAKNNAVIPSTDYGIDGLVGEAMLSVKAEENTDQDYRYRQMGRIIHDMPRSMRVWDNLEASVNGLAIGTWGMDGAVEVMNGHIINGGFYLFGTVSTMIAAKAIKDNWVYQKKLDSLEAKISIEKIPEIKQAYEKLTEIDTKIA